MKVTSEKTTSTYISPVSRLVMSTMTTDSSYPAINNALNVLVVNDDEENDYEDPLSKSKSISSSLSHNPSYQSSASSSALNLASLTQLCHKTNNFKKYHQNLGHSHLQITDKHSLHHMLKSSSSLATKSYFLAEQPDSITAENISNSINKTSLPVHVVKRQLPNLLDDQLLSSSVSLAASSAPIKLGEKLFYLNNSYV